MFRGLIGDHGTPERYAFRRFAARVQARIETTYRGQPFLYRQETGALEEAGKAWKWLEKVDTEGPGALEVGKGKGAHQKSSREFKGTRES